MGSELPEDILLLIFGSLEVPDLVGAGSVCSSWHGAYIAIRDDLGLGKQRQPQALCLLYTSESSSGESTTCLYSVTEKKAYTLRPLIRSWYCIGSAHGWIIAADECSELHLVNPITGDQIELPSITTIKQVIPIYDDNGTLNRYYSWAAGNSELDPPDTFDLSQLREYFFDKAFLSSDPSTGSYIVVLIHNTRGKLSFARSGDDSWTPLPHKRFTDCVFKDDLMYALTTLGAIHAFDFSGPAVKQTVVLEEMKDYTYEIMQIVQAPSGELLQIWWEGECGRKGKDYSVRLAALQRLLCSSYSVRIYFFSSSYSVSAAATVFAVIFLQLQPQLQRNEQADDNDSLESERDDSEPYRHYSTLAKVYRVDLAAKEPVEISSLGENVLFLGQNQSVCLSAQEHPQLKANHIYITDMDEYIILRKDMERDIAVLDLGNNRREKIVCPQSWSNWPNPVWITPNPRKARLQTGRNTGGRERVPNHLPMAVREAARWCTTGEGSAGGKTWSLIKVDAKTWNYYFDLIAIFIFDLLGKIRAICCSIVQKASLYRER